ncbi:MAG: carbonic anhydrase family protein [Anaerolineaceae bacterium]|nr:carbonic anhydrase family protein [Anaerolineaceae bacterium]
MSSLTLVALTMAGELHWGYEGETGPDNWGSLSPDYAPCADGRAQSPIDIRNASELELAAIHFDYGETPNVVTNTGHGIQVDVEGDSHILYNGIRYDLLQFHFHAPSEHTIDGQAAAMEVHFVHQDPNSGMLAVVGILLEEAEVDNEAYAPVFSNLPREAGRSVSTDDGLALGGLLPQTLSFYTYQGSLTTPPCSEIVRWLLLDTPVSLSAEQIAAYTAIYANNARPVQPLGDRDLLRASE